MSIRSLIGFVVMSLALPLFAAPRNDEMDKALSQIQASKSPAEARPAMEFILAHATEAPALHLFLGSAIALNGERLEDAAYLFYVAQMRMRYDLTRFPTNASGGDSPAVALGAIAQQLGAELNPAVMRQPATFAKVVERIKTWAPANPKDYKPGWEYTSVKDADSKKQFDENRAAFVKQFGGLSALLNDPEYFAAFQVLQSFNLSPYDEQQKAERVNARDAAVAKMRGIETKRGIEGLFYKKTP